ncbi:biotin synthase BioB [Vallitalea pronyensis]|uniref:Biotin synthase n=1 Tax=Vallitalea pronyensis TaxID=1348613 RepID=A0A8J8MNX9_9FIRM|nr:biotin synthase BioB [Vallitalea pronyensis]QUI25051.1 biotin synthase BioB [Vallitalea pronyensis]
MKNIIHDIINDYSLTKEEASQIYQSWNSDKLFEGANAVREHYMGNKVDLCTIMNAKSGRCSEDCKYCAQSIHYKTGIQEYPLISKEEAIKRAEENSRYGVHHFSLVTSGKGLTGKDFDQIIEIYEALHAKLPNLRLCASLGILHVEQAIRLKEAGVTTYHHNLETSRRYYREVCTTHTYDDRVATIKNAQNAGLAVCSGGIMGIGETLEDRMDMAFDLRELGISSVPLNVLHPVAGTPYGDNEMPAPEDILRTMAIYRLILPKSYIRYAGGRMALEEYQEKGFKAGVNAALVGNYLTTIGNKIADDIHMICQLGFRIT